MVSEGTLRMGGSMHVDPALLLSGIAATSRDCIVCVGRDETIVWASDAAESMLGWRPSELVGQPISVLVPARAAEVHAAYVRRVLAGEDVPPYVDVRTRRGGAHVQVSVTLGGLRGPEGAIVGVTSLLRDVTDELTKQRSLERALEASRARFEQASTAQAVIDLRGVLVSVNAAWCELFGHPADYFVERTLTSLVHPLDAANAAEQLAPQREGLVDSARYQLVFRDARGQSLPLLLETTTLRNPDGAPHAVAIFARDVAEVRDAAHELGAQENLYLSLSRRSWDAAMVTDAGLDVVYATPLAARMLGYGPEELVGRTITELLHPEDVDKVRPVIDRVVELPQYTEHVLVRMRDSSGNWRWIEQTLTNCLADPDIAGLVANLRDLTDQVESERLLRFSEALHRAIVETAQEGIVATAPDGATMLANEKLGEILGLSLETINRLDMRELLRPLPREQNGASGQIGPGGPARYETSYLHPDGGTRVLHVTRSLLHHDGAEPLGWLSMVSDVTDARRVEDELRRQALHDPLTGLPNRYLVLDRLKMAAARQRRAEGTPMGVLFLDLDGFKPINDSRGHEAGDELLKEIGSRLARAVRATDTVGRLGGDEFAIICEHADEAALLRVASRIHRSLADPVALAGGPLRVTISIGAAMSPPYEVADLIRAADGAMYDAKQRGGGRTALAGGPGAGSQPRDAGANPVP